MPPHVPRWRHTNNACARCAPRANANRVTPAEAHAHTCSHLRTSEDVRNIDRLTAANRSCRHAHSPLTHSRTGMEHHASHAHFVDADRAEQHVGKADGARNGVHIAAARDTACEHSTRAPEAAHQSLPACLYSLCMMRVSVSARTRMQRSFSLLLNSFPLDTGSLRVGVGYLWYHNHPPMTFFKCNDTLQAQTNTFVLQKKKKKHENTALSPLVH